MDRYLAAARAICDNYDLHGYRESDFDPVQDIAETIAGCDSARMDELERQAALCRKHGPVRSVPGHPTRLACTLCGKWNPVKPKWSPNPVHHKDCPHNEVEA